MCGIFGGRLTSENLNTVCDNFVKNLTHRGPDGHGYYTDTKKNLFLGNTRLSILDIENGSQPFYSNNKDVVCVQNGEIFNYREINDYLKTKGFINKTNCDTETILNSYLFDNEFFLKSFNGMFSISIYDQKLDQILIARDRLGVKPLYYYHSGDTFIFCSEIKPILNVIGKSTINPYGIASYLKSNYVNSNFTIYKDVMQLQPGHFLIYKNKNITIKKYWGIDDTESYNSYDNEILETIQDTIISSLKLRNRSDVPVGAFLSSGKDSALVCSYFSKYISKELKTFTLKFNNSSLDESPFAHTLSQKLGLKCQSVFFNENIESEWYSIQKFLDQPHGDSSFIPTAALAKEFTNYSKVVLTGDGADELYGGYSRYFNCLNDLNTNNTLFDNYFNRISIFDDHELANFSTSELQSQLKRYQLDCKNVFYDTNLTCPFNQLLNYDIKTILPNNNLIKPDRMGMRFSIEARNPLIDYRLAELSFTFLKPYQTYSPKEPLHCLLTHTLPKFSFRKKMMFSVPYKILLEKVLLTNKIKDDFKSVYELNKDFFKYNQMLNQIDYYISTKNVVKLRNLFCLFAWFKGLVNL